MMMCSTLWEAKVSRKRKKRYEAELLRNLTKGFLANLREVYNNLID